MSIGQKLRESGLTIDNVDINQATKGLTRALLGIAELSPEDRTDASAAFTAPKILADHGKSEGSFRLGVTMGSELRGRGLTGDDVNPHEVTDGLSDALLGKAVLPAADNTTMVAAVASGVTATEARNRETARAFLEENGTRRGVVTTASGLQYRVLNAGKGNSPRPADALTFHYRGTLLDGTEFDSTRKRGAPAKSDVATLIRGLQEALLLMKPGAKWELYIPPELAYEKNLPPTIPPGSLLRFEVELLSVEPIR